MVGIAAVGLSTLAIAPASARDVDVSQGDDYAYLDQLGSKDRVGVCDIERDGHGVYVKVWLDNGYDEFSDGNGSATGCSTRDYGAYSVDSIEVCESVTGPDWCSDRKYS